MLARLRRGEWIAVLGLAGLIATLFLKWFTVDVAFEASSAVETVADGTEGSSSAPMVMVETVAGWGDLGRPWADFLVVAGIAVLVMLAMTLRAGPGRPTYGAVVSLIAAGAVTFVVTLLTAIRVLLARPGVEVPADAAHAGIDFSVGIGVGGWVGLASLIVILVGLWIAVADDRTGAAESATEPPAPRPVPAPGPSASGDGPA